MSITRERFEQGLTVTGYKARMTLNRERFEANERAAAIPRDAVCFFSQLPQPLPVVVITEDWCELAIAQVPALARLAVESGKLNLRFFLRDQNLDLMNRYLKDGRHASIPTFVFFDQDFQELGRWIEVPAKIKHQLRIRLEAVYAAEPMLAGIPFDTPIPQLPEAARQRVFRALVEFQAQTQALVIQEVIREIHELLESRLKRR